MGLPLDPATGAIRVSGAGGGGGGDASAANQLTEIARLEAIRDRLPAALNADGGLAVHIQNASAGGDPLSDGDDAGSLPTKTLWVAGADGTVLRGIRVTSGGFVRVNVENTVPVSGTFWQATQPVSGPLTDTQLRATPVPVSGTVTANTGLTQPLTDTQLRASAVPVDTELTTADLDTGAGTDTKAVVGIKVAASGGAVDLAQPLTDTQIRATPLPVSGTVTASGPLTDTQLRASAVPVSGPLTDTQLRASAVPVSGPLTDTQLRASVVPVGDGAGSLTVDAPVGTPLFARLSDGAAALIGQKVMASSLPVALASDQSALATTAPTLTKGTQGANGWSIQELKDAGRVNIMWTAEVSPAATAEGLLTVTESRDGGTTTTFTTKVVTSGKRLRITSMSLAVENTLGTSLQRAYLRMRFNTAGAVTTSSPQQHVMAAQAAGTVKSIASTFDDFPDGIEFLGDGTKQIGFTLTAPDWVSATSTLKCYVAIFGFEY